MVSNFIILLQIDSKFEIFQYFVLRRCFRVFGVKCSLFHTNKKHSHRGCASCQKKRTETLNTQTHTLSLSRGTKKKHKKHLLNENTRQTQKNDCVTTTTTLSQRQFNNDSVTTTLSQRQCQNRMWFCSIAKQQKKRKPLSESKLCDKCQQRRIS